jgi:hypothetical protein
MNFDRNLSKYLTPNVTEPKITDTSPTNIAMYSCFYANSVTLGVSMNSSAASGAETLISFEP